MALTSMGTTTDNTYMLLASTTVRDLSLGHRNFLTPIEELAARAGAHRRLVLSVLLRERLRGLCEAVCIVRAVR